MKKIVGSVVVYKSDWALLEKTIDSFFVAAPASHVGIWDNSSDHALKNKLQNKYGNNVSYLSSGINIGYGAGHNRIFNSISSDYFCVLNPDILISDKAITTCTTFLEKNGDFGLVSCSILNPDGSVQHVHKMMPSFTDYVRLLTQRLLGRTSPPRPGIKATPDRIFYPIISGCFMVFSHWHYKELGGFDERYFLYFEDYDLSLRSFLKGKSIVLNSVSITHSWGKGSHKKISLFLLHALSGLKFYNKWGVSSKKALEVNAMAYKLNHPT